MTGWIVFLPLVSAFVGAIIGAWANSWYRNREAKKAERRDLLALLLLVDVEVWANDERLQACVDQGDFDPFAVAGLRTEDWEMSKVRLAQLISIGHFHTLVTYYEMVRKIRTAIQTYSEDMDGKQFFAIMSSTVQNARSVGSLARQDNRKYLPEDRYVMYQIPDPKDPVRDNPAP